MLANQLHGQPLNGAYHLTGLMANYGISTTIVLEIP